MTIFQRDVKSQQTLLRSLQILVGVVLVGTVGVHTKSTCGPNAWRRRAKSLDTTNDRCTATAQQDHGQVHTSLQSRQVRLSAQASREKIQKIEIIGKYFNKDEAVDTAKQPM